MDTPETLKSRLYHLQTQHDQDVWVEKCQGYPIFKKQESIFKLKYYSLPSNQLFYEIVVNSNIRFDKNQNGVQWIQIKEGEIMAISFKEDFSANAFWNMIDEYQRKYEVSVPAATGTHFYFQYRVPDPTINNLHEFFAQIEKIPENQRHERLCSILLTKRQFLPRLHSVFQALEKEDPKNIEKLQIMFYIMKAIFNAANDELLLELMCNDLYPLLLGALQYDPNFRNHRPAHREFIAKHSKIIPVVPFKNSELFNLSIITYRLQYVRECVLMPYLNDYSFAATARVIRMNYKKILSHIFNPRRKDFINQLFDHLRKQDPFAYRMLREMFRITKNIYSTENLYLHIAQRDFFELFIKNIKDLKDIETGVTVNQVQVQANKFKRKYKPVDIAQCVDIGFDILEQFMQYEPLHFKNFCVSQSQKFSKYPSVSFLLSYYDNCKIPASLSKLQNILKMLVTNKDSHDIKEVVHAQVLEKFLESKEKETEAKWISIFNRILTPMSVLIGDQIDKILDILFLGLFKGSKQFQINILQGIKTIISTYIETEECVANYLFVHCDQFVKFFLKEKGSMGIKVSILLSIVKPKKFNKFVVLLIEKLEKTNNKLMNKYLKYLKQFLVRQEIVLPNDLKRDRDIIKDDQCFESIEKKIKID